MEPKDDSPLTLIPPVGKDPLPSRVCRPTRLERRDAGSQEVMLRDVLGDEKAAILAEELGIFIEQMKTLGWKDLKSWQEFFSVLKPPPTDRKGFEDRIVANFLHYRTNYLLIICLIFLIRILLAPILFLCIVLCVGIAYALLIAVKGPLSVGEYEINETGKIAICSLFSFFFLGLCGALEHFLWGLVIGLCLCSLHMVFRPRNLSSTGNKAYEEFKLSTSQWFGARKSPSSASSSSSSYERKHGEVEEDLESTSGYDDAGDSMSYHSAGLTSASMRKRTGK
jgi:hypothetical protein